MFLLKSTERRAEMKKFIIYLSSFLLLFGVSVAFAGVYIEDFEDGELDPEWSVFPSTPLPYSIDKERGNFHLHMFRGLGNPDVNSELGLWLEDDYIYRLEADIYATPSVDQWVGLEHLWDDTAGVRRSVHLLFHTLSGEINTEFVNSDTGFRRREVLGYVNTNLQQSLSITFHDLHVTLGINGSETNTSFLGFYQKPDSIEINYSYVHGVTQFPNDVDYYADNIKVYSSTGPTTPTIYEVVDSVEEWVEDSDLTGTGDGASADRRLNAFENMINTAVALFEDGDIAGACVQLAAAVGKCDGESPPPDLVEGDASEELEEMIEGLMTDFECE
jgi:hypothetical protein